MSKIGDLWVRLGLKKEDYTKGLEDAKKETASFGESVKTMGGKVKVAYAAIAGAVVAVFNAVRSLAQQNQALGDAWNRTAAGMAASWDAFKTSIAAMDFSHLLSNLREANRLARDLYDARDAMGEIGTSYDIAYSDQLKTINQLRVRLQDMNLSDQERIKAGQQLLDIYRKLEENPTRGLLNVSDAELNTMAQKLGYNLSGASEEAMAATRREVKDFFVWLGTAQGEAYNAAAQTVAKRPLGIDSALGQTFMRNAANNGMERFAQLAVAYNKNVNDKQREAMAQAIRAYGEQDARYDAETRRIQTMMNSIRHQSASGSGAATGAGAGTQASVDLFQQELDLIRKESTELAQVRAEDEAIAAEADAAYQAWREMNGMEPPKLWDDDMTAALERGLEASRQMGEEMDELKQKALDLSEAFAQNLVTAIEDGLVGAFDALAEVLGGVSEGGMENIAKALLEPLADMAIKAGTLIMMSGTAIDALKESLVGFFGGSAVAAGLALVGVGIAAKAGLAALGNRGSNAGTVSSFASGGGDYTRAGGVSTAELTVNVVGTIKGSDIILSGANTLKDWNR